MRRLCFVRRRMVDVDLLRSCAFIEIANRSPRWSCVMYRRHDVSKYGVVQTDASGRIIRFQEKPTREQAVSSTINTGIYVFEPEIFQYIPSGVEFDIGGQLLPELVRNGQSIFGITLPFACWI